MRAKPSDLRRLYRLLEQKAHEAADRQTAGITLQPGQTQAQLEELRTSVNAALALVLRLYTKSGEWISGTTIDSLNDEQLPDGLTRIEFDSAFIYRLRFNNTAPNNSLVVTIDLVRPSVLDMGAEPMANLSTANISGVDLTWANGLCEELATFFRQGSTNRGWLHSRQSYTVLLMLLGFPLSFNIVYHLDRLILHGTTLPEALSVAVDVYVVLDVLFAFRILFNYSGWVFPKVEVDAPRQHIGVRHRIAISALAVMVIGAMIKAALKLFGIA